MDVWICGYMDIWMYGYMDVWTYGYMDPEGGSTIEVACWIDSEMDAIRWRWMTLHTSGTCAQAHTGSDQVVQNGIPIYT